MIKLTDIAWAAGFLEGEGSFRFESSPRVLASQVQREPLEKLEKIFGGQIKIRHNIGNPLSNKPIYCWDLPSQRSVQVMMTLWSFMSSKRKLEIEFAVNQWKAGKGIRRSKWATSCMHGHKLEGDNVYWYRGYAKCKECRKLTQSTISLKTINVLAEQLLQKLFS